MIPTDTKNCISRSCRREIDADSVYCKYCGAYQLRNKRKKEEIKVAPPRQLPSGSWFGRVTVDGKRVSVTEATEEAWYIRARAVKSGMIEEEKKRKPITLGTAIDTFIKDNANVLSPSTVKAYKSYRKHRFTKYMDTEIGAIPYQRMVNEEAKEISAKTLANIWRLVTASLRAQELQIPAVTLPKIAKSSRPWLDYEQIYTFLDAIKGQDCEVAALLALNGLRRSELLNMTSDKVDLEKGLLEVRGAMVYNDEGKFIAKETNKNASSARTVHIVIPRLTELLKGKEGPLVTSKPNTTYVQVNRICEAAGLPQVGVHGLRHSFASLAYHLGWSEATTMREGGWNTSKTVHEIYTHLAQQDIDADVASMQQFYQRQNGNENGNVSKK